jgi:serine protease Do
LVITKASEIVGGNLTCRLPDGEAVEASLVLVNEENDLGLVRVNATGLTPIQWASEEAVVGQWAVTPGIETYPETVGIISVPPRKIPPGRALIGVQLDSGAVIAGLMEGYGAEKAGLKPGDVVLAVNDQNVGSSPELTRALRQYRQGEKVKLLVRRGEEEFETEVRMMVHPERTRDRPVRRFVGEVSRRAAGFDLVLQHDSVLSPWQCGGPLLNLEGKAIGVNIARAGRIASYALPARLVQEIIEDLESRSQLMVDHQEGVETGR